MNQNSKTLQIRNSTIDFLTFTRRSGEESIEVRVQDNDVWLTQASIAKLFGVERSVITKHLKTVFDDGEIVQSGSHEQLMKEGGLHSELWNAQAQYYA